MNLQTIISKLNLDKSALKFIGTAAMLVAMLLVFDAITNGMFVSQRNITMLFRQAAVLMIISSGLMMLLIERNFDLSAGAGVYLVGVIIAILVVRQGFNPWLAAGIAITIGVLMGTIQGFFIGVIGVPAFIATLSGQMIFRGTGYVITNAATIGPIPREFTRLSEGFISPEMTMLVIPVIFALYILFSFITYKKMQRWYGGVSKLIFKIILAAVFSAGAMYIFVGYNGIPMAVCIAAVVVVIMHFVGTKTVYGRQSYIIGGNPEAAKLAGINTKKRIWQSYIIMGFLYGIGGTVLIARLGNSTPTAGVLLELDAVAAAVIGGVSMAGGVGTMFGTVIGVLILASIDNVMSLMNVSSHLQMVIKGIILISAVSLDIYINRSKFKFRLLKSKE